MTTRRALQIAAKKFIRPGQRYLSTLADRPQVMTVQSVSETEVHFTRKGVSGIFIMEILRFCEIAVPINETTTKAAAKPQEKRK